MSIGNNVGTPGPRALNILEYCATITDILGNNLRKRGSFWSLAFCSCPRLSIDYSVLGIPDFANQPLPTPSQRRSPG